MQCVKQINSYDCGIHLLCNAEALIGKLILNKSETLFELTNSSLIEMKREQIKMTILELSELNE